MTPEARELISRRSLKGWKLLRVLTNARTHCDYCGARIVYAFECSQDEPSMRAYLPDDVIYVGSECVRSFIDGFNGKESVAFLKSKWRQRRSYFWKRFRDQVVIVGRNKSGSWWVATGASVVHSHTWRFSQRRFDSARAAQAYVSSYVITGVPPAPRVVSGVEILDQVKRSLAVRS